MSQWSQLYTRKLLLGAVLPVFFSLAMAAQSLMTVRTEERHDVSQPLRDMIQAVPKQALTIHEAEPVRRIPLPTGLATLPDDPVRQRTAASIAAFAPVVGLGFEGLGNGQYGFSVTGAPPDTNGAVGATQYVQWVNTSFAIFNKSTGALISGPTAGNSLWSGFGGGCQNNNDGDAGHHHNLHHRQNCEPLGVQPVFRDHHTLPAVHCSVHELRRNGHLQPLFLSVQQF